MKKYIFGGIAVLAIAAGATVNVNFGTKSNELSSVSLANVEALAASENNNANSCPGGYCSWTGSFESCTACCPAGKNPRCTSFACECN